MSCYLDFTGQKNFTNGSQSKKSLSSNIGSIFNTKEEYVHLSFLDQRSLSNSYGVRVDNKFLNICQETHNLSRIVKDRSVSVGKMENDDANMFLTVIENGIKEYVNSVNFDCEINFYSSYSSNEYSHLLQGVSNNHDWSMSTFKNKGICQLLDL